MTSLFFNWKMYCTDAEHAKNLMSEYKTLVNSYETNTNFALFIPVTYFYLLSTFNLNEYAGSQDVSENISGAFTGEISIKQISDFGLKYVMIGHSETRKNFKYTDEIIAGKFKTVLENGLTPVLCIDYFSSEKKIELEQILELYFVRNSELLFEKDVYLAIEPTANIGTTTTFSSIEIKNNVQIIQHYLQSKNINCRFQYLYGGGLNPSNAKLFLQESEVDGFLIGGYSQKPADFVNSL
jgi:triosephosphate isomerase (TIM)